MAIRKIRENDDPILRKISKPVIAFDKKTAIIIEDMLDTMYEANGVGLAAVQVGILKRIVVMDIGEGPIVLINPEIISVDGEQTGYEGCLSVPGKTGVVKRPNHVIVRAADENGNVRDVEGEELLARCICHECDHLDGKLYIDMVEGELIDNDLLEEEEE